MRRTPQGLAGRGLLCQSVAGVTGMNAVEPVSGGKASTEAGGACLNCCAPLLGEYCASCGQKARLHRSLRAFFADLAAGLFNFDGKFWRTLPMLAWRPGELTRRYVEGQRACFISPVGLYLFSVFLMFAVLGFTGSMPTVGDPQSFYAEAMRDEQAKLQKLQAERGQLRTGDPRIAEVELRLARARSDVADLEKLRSGNADGPIQGLNGSPEWVRRAVTKAATDPQAAMTRVQEAASTYSWLLIPLSVPALRLLFPFRRRKMFDHTVFVTYSLAFMMLLVILGGLLSVVGAGGYIAWLALIPPWHMYRQLKGAYQLTRTGALVRTVLLLFAAATILLFWVGIVAAIGSLT